MLKLVLLDRKSLFKLIYFDELSIFLGWTILSNAQNVFWEGKRFCKIMTRFWHFWDFFSNRSQFDNFGSTLSLCKNCEAPLKLIVKNTCFQKNWWIFHEIVYFRMKSEIVYFRMNFENWWILKIDELLKIDEKIGEFFMKLSIFEWNRWTIKLWLTNSHRDGPSTLWLGLVTADCRCPVYIKRSNSWFSHKMKHFSNN